MDLTHIPGLAALPAHRRLLERAAGHFQGDPRVVGVILGGSFAAGSPDVYSDIDLYIIVDDKDFPGVLADREKAAAAAGPALVEFVPDHLGPGGDEMYIALYEGPVKADFNYVRASMLRPEWYLAKRLVLHDTGTALRDVIRASAGLTPPPPPRAQMEALHEKFWCWCWYVFGKVVRGELWEALEGVHFIRSLALVPLLEWDAHRPAEGYRRLESRVGEELRARLERTLSTLDPGTLYGALEAEMDLFCDLQSRLAPRYGIPIDQARGAVIREAIRRAWKARASR